MFKRSACLAALIVPLAGAAAPGADLVMIAPLNQNMPLAQFHNDKLSGGILKDLDEAIAQRLGRGIVHVSVAGEQVSEALATGKADGICYVRPFWIDGQYDWSQPLIPDAELVASVQGAPPVRSLADLRDRPVGTVAGYRYPRVEQVLGLRFQRSESPTMEENLRKLMTGGVRHTVIGKATLAYQMRINKTLRLRQDLVFASFKAQCAFSKTARVPFEEINQAINGLIDDGSVDQILARYR
ncbi:transporter substrate-binding domain-containing protein [Massilia sp. CCM 9210]|uniref:substrate-binding periplasmic protein n=1 Tax=Massilia scottii TaxID=3057166 RepID=UPI002796C6A1|nr:transporter substrate-binding domain-containing protein [Massilia sp. CCM 9210]MDQ1817490.1 transporter substrate-binding domain-containing protein [Massilia sp. CCM 9210]